MSITEPAPSPARRLLLDPEWLTYAGYLWRRRRRSIAAVPFRLLARLFRFYRRAQSEIAYSQLETVTPAADVPPRYLVSHDEINQIVQFCREKFPERVAQITRSADRIVEGTIDVFGKPVRTSDTGALGDPEQRFYLNRWYHSATLAKAFAYTESEQYVNAFIRLLSDWIRDHSMAERGEAWESYSVSERIANWLFAHHVLSRSETYRQRCSTILLGELRRHAEYLSANLETRVIHNHVINNARALFLYGVLCRSVDAGSTRFVQVGWSILREQLRRQVSAEGFLREQSSHYQLLILVRYAEVFLLARRNGIAVGEDDLAILRKMFEAASLFVRPDGSLVLIGDVSPDLVPEEAVDLMSLAELFDAPGHVRPNEKSVWYSGVDTPPLRGGRKRLTTMGGHVIYSTPEVHFVFRCDPDPSVIRHGHDDALSFDLWARGRSIIVDPGNATFLPNSWGQYFRSAEAHNAVTIDDVAPSIRSATIQTLTAPDYPRPTSSIEQVEALGNGVHISARHTRYHRLRQPVDIRRDILLTGDREIRIRDFVEGEGVHKIQIRLHLGPGAADVQSSGGIVRVKDDRGRGIVQVDFQSAAPLSIDALTASAPPATGGWFSPQYGCVVPTTTIFCSAVASLPASIDTIVRFGPEDRE